MPSSTAGAPIALLVLAGLAGVLAPPAAARPLDPPAVAAPSSDAGCDAPLPAVVGWADAQRRLSACSPALRVARRTIDAARADVAVAGQRPNPTLTVGVGDVSSRTGLGGGGPLDKQLDYSARLDQPFERGGKRELRIEGAEHAWRSAAWSAADVLRQQRAALAQAWIDLWGAQERVRLHDELTAIVGRALDAARRRLRAGDVAAADVVRIELDAQRAEADRLAALGELARARGEVAALLAAPCAAATLRADEPWPALQRIPEPAAPGEALRPDLLAARARVEAIDAQSRLARSLRVRDVGVGLQVDRYAPPAGNGWILGAYVSVPLFVAHRYEGEIARAEAERELAVATRVRLEQQALADLRRFLEIRAAAAVRRERIERDALPVAERVAANAELAWRRGAGTVLELLDALRQLRALQFDALAARLDLDRADAAARAEMLTDAAAADPVFGESIRIAPTAP